MADEPRHRCWQLFYVSQVTQGLSVDSDVSEVGLTTPPAGGIRRIGQFPYTTSSSNTPGVVFDPPVECYTFNATH